MYDKNLFKEICDLSCSFEKLKSFNEVLASQEFDLDNSFEKYYSIETIIKAINKYKDGLITGEHLAYWANAYNWIIMATTHNKIIEDNDTADFKEYIEYEISDWLDGLSFFDETDTDEDINSYFEKLIAELKDYDYILRTYDKLKIYCKEQKVIAKNTYENLVFLCINPEEKFYFIFDDININYQRDDVDENRLTEEKFAEKIKALKDSGYKQLIKEHLD